MKKIALVLAAAVAAIVLTSTTLSSPAEARGWGARPSGHVVGARNFNGRVFGGRAFYGVGAGVIGGYAYSRCWRWDPYLGRNVWVCGSPYSYGPYGY